jgi:hypothetical protein
MFTTTKYLNFSHLRQSHIFPMLLHSIIHKKMLALCILIAGARSLATAELTMYLFEAHLSSKYEPECVSCLHNTEVINKQDEKLCTSGKQSKHFNRTAQLCCSIGAKREIFFFS